MSGWCVGNLLPLTARERLFCMVAASAADLDAVSYLFGQNAYWDWHHLACHNLAFAVVVSGALALFSTHRLLAGCAYLALAHLHLALDYLGSGPGWPIPYGWPLLHATWVNPEGWDYSSWQNKAVAGGFLLWVLVVAAVRGRTPVELLAPSLDRRFVEGLRRMLGVAADTRGGAEE